jgi:nucleotide-binding universal stress UspA family protein
MKTIVIATDGSSAAREALEFGLDLATKNGSEVHCVHVVRAFDYTPVTGYRLAVTPPVTHEMTVEDRAPLEQARQLAAGRGLDVRTELLHGRPAAEIVAYADTVDADLIVVGSRGHGALPSALVGSVAHGVLHRARRPVLVVRGVRHPEHAGASAAL